MTEDSRLKTHEYKLAHPGGNRRDEIELAIFRDHRFSFYYWMKWARKSDGAPPALVTIDWHRDLAPPSEADQKALDRISEAGLPEIWRFTETELDPHNDAQVLSAAWLNLIGDIVLLKNYGMKQEETCSDRNGDMHRILEFEIYESFSAEILSRDDHRIYLDIDLDYFVKNKVAPHQRKDVRLYADKEIREIINPDNKLFRYLFNRIEGITIATEPRYCGGIGNSSHLLKVVLERLFTPGMDWKHLA